MMNKKRILKQGALTKSKKRCIESTTKNLLKSPEKELFAIIEQTAKENVSEKNSDLLAQIEEFSKDGVYENDISEQQKIQGTFYDVLRSMQYSYLKNTIEFYFSTALYNALVDFANKKGLIFKPEIFEKTCEIWLDNFEEYKQFLLLNGNGQVAKKKEYPKELPPNAFGNAVSNFIKKDLDNGYWIDIENNLYSDMATLRSFDSEVFITIKLEQKYKQGIWVETLIKTHHLSGGNTKREIGAIFFIKDGKRFEKFEDALEYKKYSEEKVQEFLEGEE